MIKPTSMDDSREICDYLLQGKAVVLNMEGLHMEIAQRIIEIVNGKAEFYNGNYTFYAEEKQRRYEELRRQYEKNQKEIAHLQKAADDLHLWAFMGADKLHKQATMGSGLGLSIVKEVLDKHAARYGVESALGVGSVFWFELPLSKPQEGEGLQ